MTTFTWALDADGDWSDGTNWDTGTAPNNGATVTISTADAHTITYAGTSWLAGLTLGSLDTLEIDAGTLALKGSSTIGGTVSGAGQLSVIGGTTTLNGSAALAMANLTLWGTGATLQLAMTITYAGTFLQGNGATLSLSGGPLTLTGDATVLNGIVNGANRLVFQKSASIGTLTVGGTASVENARTATQLGGTVTIGDAGTGAATLINDASATYAIADDSNIGRGAATGSRILNQGLFTKTGGTGTSTVAASMQSVGSIAVMSGTLAFSGPSNTITGAMSGTAVQFVGGNTVIGSGATVTVASLGIAGTGTHVTLTTNLTYTGPFSQGSGSVLSIAGSDTLTLTGPSMLQGAVNGAGALALAGGGGTTLGAGAALATGTFALSGSGTTMTLGTNLVYRGAFSAAAGTLATLSGGYLLLAGAATFTGAKVNGTQRLYAEGATTIAGLTIGGSVLFQTTSTTTQSGGALTLGDGAGRAILFNTAGASYAIADDSGIGIAPASSNAYILNRGTFGKSGGTGTTTVSASFVDLGSVAVASGTLAFMGRSNSFTGTISGAGTVAVAGNSVLQSGSVLSAAGLTVSGGTLTLVDSLTYGGAFTVAAKAALMLGSGNTLTLTGNSTLAGSIIGGSSLVLMGGGTTTIGAYTGMNTIGTSSVSVVGSRVVIAGNVNVTGSFTQDVGSTTTLSGAMAVSGATSLHGALAGGRGGTLMGYGDVAISGGLSMSGFVGLDIHAAAMQSNGDLILTSKQGGYSTLGIESGATYTIADDSSIRNGVAISYLNNGGLLEKSGGNGTTTIDSNISNSGTISVLSGTLDLTSYISNVGRIDISNSATLQLDLAVYDQRISFSDPGGTLVLNNVPRFHGSIDLGAHDVIQMSSNFTFKVFYENSTGTAGSLYVNNGRAQYSLLLNGQYDPSGFSSTTADGHTLISYTSPSQQAALAGRH